MSPVDSELAHEENVHMAMRGLLGAVCVCVCVCVVVPDARVSVTLKHDKHGVLHRHHSTAQMHDGKAEEETVRGFCC